MFFSNKKKFNFEIYDFNYKLMSGARENVFQSMR